MKKITFITILIMAAMFLCSCFSTNTPAYTYYEFTNTAEVNNTPAISKNSSEESYNFNSNSNPSSESSSFTNEYGTPTTKCAHSGCTNYIASSGDTNCCTTHSNKCLVCGKYIDEDALYCMGCIYAAATKGSTSSSFTNEYGTPTTKCSHSGCTNYIASSGDTNCCTTHSNKCLVCGKYLDEDALYCMGCISAAATKGFTSSGS